MTGIYLAETRDMIKASELRIVSYKGLLRVAHEESFDEDTKRLFRDNLNYEMWWYKHLMRERDELTNNISYEQSRLAWS